MRERGGGCIEGFLLERGDLSVRAGFLFSRKMREREHLVGGHDE